MTQEELLTAPVDRELKRIVYSAEEIGARIRRMGEAITAAYPPEKDLLILGLLKGSFIMVADLVRCISRPLHVDFLVAASYGKRLRSSGEVELLHAPAMSLEGRDVILVEDIIDSGNTINELVPRLEQRDPASLEICALLHKHAVEDLVREPRWTGFDAPDEFLVGYGLDHAEDFRHLPYIASLRDTSV